MLKIELGAEERENKTVYERAKHEASIFVG
jgi:hypothetical protein